MYSVNYNYSNAGPECQANCLPILAESHSSVIENRGSLIRSPAWPIFFPRIDDSHCDRILSSLTAVRCFDNDYVGKHAVAWKEYCAEYWLNRFHASMDRCAGPRNVSEILSQTPLNTVQPINQLPVQEDGMYKRSDCTFCAV